MPLVELKLCDGASFYVAPHAVLALGPADTCEECKATASLIFLAGGSIQVAGTVDDVRTALFPPPAAQAEANEDVDPLQLFLDHYTVRAEDAEVSSRDLYDAYDKWSEDNALGCWSQREVATALLRKGIKSVNGRIRKYVGIALTNGAHAKHNLRR